MKQYRRKTYLISPRSFVIVALIAALVSAGSILILGPEDNAFATVFTILSAILFLFALLDVIVVAGKYRYCDSYIEVSCLPFIKRKIRYSKYSAVVVANASYNYGIGDQLSYSIPMQYKVKGADGYTRVTLPFITLLKPEYPLHKIKSGMNNRDFDAFSSDLYHVGICWFDSFEELLCRTQLDIYILKDVYQTYMGQFDEIISQDGDMERFHIICGKDT